jgi:hypothetical protein
MALPIISYGAGTKEFKIPGYTWNSQWQPTLGSPTVNTDTVRVTPKEIPVEVFDYRNAVALEFNEQLAMAKAMAQNVGSGMKYDAYAGTFAAIATKFIALGKSYQLFLDEMAWNGRATSKFALGANGVSLATTDDIATYSFADAVPGVTTFTGGSTDAVTRRKILAFGVSATSTNSDGLFVPNVLFIDLKTFNELIADTAPNLDTNVLQYLINNNIYDAIIPVPAWNVGADYANKVTLIAAYVDPQVMFFNNALPMIQTGVAMTGDAVEMKYRTQNSGMTIVNKLGLIRCQGNRT